MVSCKACGLSRTSDTVKKNITFHRFPTDRKKRLQWIKFMNLFTSESTFTAGTFICSQHFEDTCFNRMTPVRQKLKDEAVPSINVTRQKFSKDVGQFYDKMNEIDKTKSSTSLEPINILIIGNPSTEEISAEYLPYTLGVETSHSPQVLESQVKNLSFQLGVKRKKIINLQKQLHHKNKLFARLLLMLTADQRYDCDELDDSSNSDDG